MTQTNGEPRLASIMKRAGARAGARVDAETAVWLTKDGNTGTIETATQIKAGTPTERMRDIRPIGLM